MALVTAYQKLDLTAAIGALPNETRGGSGESSTYTRDNGNISLTLTGTWFIYNRIWPNSGTVTGLELSQGGAKVASFSGLSFEFTLNNVYSPVISDAQKLYPIALSGNDRITGSDFDDVLAGFDGNDIIYGRAGNDTLLGGAGNDILVGGTGQNIIDGGAGFNIASYGDTHASFMLTKSDGGNFTMVSNGTTITDQVSNIARFSFTDGVLAFDNVAAQGYRIYQAALNRAPDRDGLSYWVDRLDKDLKLFDIANYFIGSPEFQQKYGATSNAQFVDILYRNILDRGSDPDGYSYWVGRLDQGASRAEVLVNFSDSPENTTKVAPSIVGGVWLNPDVTIA